MQELNKKHIRAFEDYYALLSKEKEGRKEGRKKGTVCAQSAMTGISGLVEKSIQPTFQTVRIKIRDTALARFQGFY